MKIVVTGGAGFIGSNIVRLLNIRQDQHQVIIVDDLSDGRKFRNLINCSIAEYIDAANFRQRINDGSFEVPDLIIHQGAVTSTTETNGRYVMDINYTFSREILHYCQNHRVRFIYASSAAVYDGKVPQDGKPRSTTPQTVYGYSKLLFDQWVEQNRQIFALQVVGLRYFNVYGPNEAHKDNMASLVLQWYQQLSSPSRTAVLFGSSHGFDPGMQSRDFVHVDDVVRTVLWMVDNEHVSGIYDVGTGRPRPFLQLAETVIDVIGYGKVEFKAFPASLLNSYQPYTCADLTKLRDAGCNVEFQAIEQGVRRYITCLLEDASV